MGRMSDLVIEITEYIEHATEEGHIITDEDIAQAVKCPVYMVRQVRDSIEEFEYQIE